MTMFLSWGGTTFKKVNIWVVRKNTKQEPRPKGRRSHTDALAAPSVAEHGALSAALLVGLHDARRAREQNKHRVI